MPIRIPQILLRPTPVILFALGGSSIGYGAYRLRSTSANKSSTSLNPSTFTSFTLASKEPISSTSAVFTLRHDDPQTSQIIQEIRDKACIWSVQAKQPQLQIARSYSPLPSSQKQEEPDGAIRLLIRREHNGEVSTYLHNLPFYSTLELRGPYVELEIPEAVTEILFLAGGTGIAPAMQVADIIARREDRARCQILWANRRREDCVGGDRRSVLPGRLSGWRSLFGLEENVVTVSEDETTEKEDKGLIVRELEALKEKAMGKVDVAYFVDEESDFIKSGHVLEHLRHSLRHNGSGKVSEDGGQKLILVSGPDGFIEHWAGKKVWVGGHEAQGPLGGVLSRIDLKDWKVWKL